MIKIVGLGPGSKEAITVGTLELLKSPTMKYFRTAVHPTVDYIKELGISFNAYDYIYEKSNNFDEVYNTIAKDLIKQHDKHKEIIYAVPGHPLVAEKSVNILLNLCKEKNIEVKIIPAVSFIDAVIESLKLDPIKGIKIIDAFDIKNQIMDRRNGIIITQVYNRFIASEVKLTLSDYYGDDKKIFFIRAAGIEGQESVREIPIYELDRQEDIDYLTSLYIPQEKEECIRDFYDLTTIMEKLLSEDGCPWDREQTHETIKKCLVEESYEVLEAINEKDEIKLIEELGDVLFLIVFHAALGKKEGYFSERDVIMGICNKMIERHPHVFGDINVKDSEDVLVNWDKIKMQQQNLNNHTEELKHVAKTLPALLRADKVQRKASKVGFDWDEVECAMDKVTEELNEVKDVYKGKNRAKILEEIGDLIFASVNVSRFLDIDPEDALNYTIDKFINRFEYIEKKSMEKGKNIEQLSLDEMDLLWNEAKMR